MERLVELQSPPVVGQVYLVPCIEHPQNGHLPIMGRGHSDPALGYEAAKFHYHIDHRFVTKGQLWDVCGLLLEQIQFECGSLQISIPSFTPANGFTPTRVEVPKKCLREMPAFKYVTSRFLGEIRWFTGESLDHFGQFEDSMTGKTLKGTCKVCPHHGIPLGSITPIDGIITCPGHMLDFDAKTGMRIRRTTRKCHDGYRHTFGTRLPEPDF